MAICLKITDPKATGDAVGVIVNGSYSTTVRDGSDEVSALLEPELHGYRLKIRGGQTLLKTYFREGDTLELANGNVATVVTVSIKNL